ncbi:response regulator [Spirosoma agri]|uniref:histidine kinase n=1 Tax=Spirosoma agri TaxID=1987381 RepID=A0A6M0IPS3_9BACT|nr:ATP-binding protein [Spirosoma agri]NEU70286.1 response regulator [Spirosoma agri]
MRLLCLLILLPVTLFAQVKGWQELTISDGLSQGMIFSIKQDQKGFIWVATKDGLNRYDGYNFTVFTHDPYNKYSLSTSACSALLVDSRDRLWIGTLNKGLNLYDDRTHRFYHIDMSDPALPDAGNYEIILLTEDPEGNIWVGTSQNKLVKITLSGALKTGFPDKANATPHVQFSRFSFPLPGVASSSSPSHILFRANGQAVVSAARELYTLNWQHPQPTRYSQIRRFGSLATLFKATPDGQQPDYWFGFSADTLVGWQQTNRKRIKLPPAKNANLYLDALDPQTVAVATPDFLWLMSPAQLYAQDQLSERNAFAVMPPNLYGITKLLVDKTGNIWVGTAGYGLRKFSPRIKQFQTFLPNTSLSYVMRDRRGQIYVRNQFDYGRLDRSANRRLPLGGNTNLPAHGLQSYLMQDRQGFFWMSVAYADAQRYELVKFSENWQRLNTYLLPPGTAFGIYGNQTREDKAGHLWIGATNGNLLRFDPASETFRVFSYQSLLPKRGADIETFSLYFDRAGTGWIGTQNGLIRADHPQTTPVFSIYKNDVDNRESLSNDFVSSCIDDPYQPDKYLWVSTKGGGLEQLDKQTRSGRFTHFTEARGLPNKVVYGILTDEFKNFWLSTNRGLAQFNPKTLTFRNYTKADGLQDDEFNTGSFVKTASGELLFGGVNGLTAFQPKDVVATVGPVAPVHIIGLKINNEPVTVGPPDGILPESIEQTRQLDLSHTQNLLTLEFAVMDYANSAKNQYRYRLGGIDERWVEAGTNRFANYAQLPDGTYTFEVEGSIDGESWSKPVALTIRIHPPFYRTWWAYLVYALGLGFVVWQLYRFQTQRLLLEQQIDFEQQEATRLAELDALKTQFFTNISHEFRTPLTLILGPIEQAVNDYAQDARFPLIQRNANRLLSLINQLLDLSKLEANQLRPEPEPGDMAAFFRTLTSSFSSLADNRAIRFIVTQNQLAYWARFDGDQVEKITTNLLSNAFKFTTDGNEVRLNVAYEAGGVTLQVTDTGIGIDTANLPRIFDRFYQVDSHSNRNYEGTGIGLALVNELVKVLQGTISVDSTEGIGTTFTVYLPLTMVDEPIAAESIPPLARLPREVPLPEPSVSAGFPDPDPRVTNGQSATVSDNILLIIDDNADIRTFVRSIFEQEYQIVEAVDGQDGLGKATASLPDIIICDLMMPRLDGFGFCKALKNQPATSHIPVVMLTAKATVEDRIGGFELGADDYLTKPFNRAEIVARVRNLVQQRQRLYQWFSANEQAPKANEPVGQEFVSVLLTVEKQFVEQLTDVVHRHIDEPAFGVEVLAEAVNLSRSQLHRKLKVVLNTSPVNFIRKVRLARAAELLAGGEENVSQVAYAVGIDNLSYFSKVFQEQYGVLPSHYKRAEKSVNNS